MMNEGARSRTTQLRTGFTPEHLAHWLDDWALRREKVLSELDITAARTARRYASQCMILSEQKQALPEEIWRQAWHVLRLEVASFLQRKYGGGDDVAKSLPDHA